MRVTLSAKSILVWLAITAAGVLGLMFVYLALDAITWVLVAAFSLSDKKERDRAADF